MLSQMNFIHSLKWSFLSELASKAIAPIVFIILAKLLTPEDFGVMTAALMVIGFSQIFWEAGLGKALIQRQSDTDAASNAVFWINLGLGMLIASLLYFTAEALTHAFFHDDRVGLVIQVMTIQIVLGAVSSVHTALLQKKMQFKKLFWVRFTTVTLPGLASIPLALNGMGYWALVIGTLIGQLAQTTILWLLTPWKPTFSFQVQIAKEVGQFGFWVSVSGLLTWFYIWADSLIVGMYLGSHELGIYRTGNQFASMVFAILFGSITAVLYSHITQFNTNRERLGRAANTLIMTLIFLSVPITIIFFSLTKPISEIFFGDKWQGIGLVIGVMTLMHGYSWIVGMNGEFYRAQGKPSLETIVTGSLLIFYLMGYLYSIQQGFKFFVWTRLGLAICALFLHLWLMQKILPIKLNQILRYLILVTATSYLATLFVEKSLIEHINYLWAKLIIGGTASLLIIAPCLFFLRPNNMFESLIAQIKRS